MSNKAKKPLREVLDFDEDVDFLTESEREMRQNLDKKGNKLIMAGCLQRAGAKNGNGRRYPKHILEREIENYKKLVKERRALGELDHPDESVINLKNASHLVVDIWWQGDDVMGKIEVLDTPAGRTIKKLVEADVKLGISSRGLGSTRQQGGSTIVEDDYELICFDLVSEPSTQGAFVVKEGQERLVEGNERPDIFDKGYRINRKMNSILSKIKE